ncbi:MAG: phosphoribosylamine--glycine ligase [Dehalococcoidales bacterium]|nr:phosphoribosylamine--glycine ligase [Dehalococcoidales bacterium]
MKVLVVGSGAREHAIVWRVVQNESVEEVYCAPGNGGTALMAHNVDVSATDADGLLSLATERGIDLVIIGPETPLIAGVADQLRSAGFVVFGPSAEAARLEGSKAWAKELMQKYGIPCARSVTFDSPAEAKEYIRGQSMPIVVKADGEAAGKGVTVAMTHEEAISAVTAAMEERVFGKAGDVVVVEECLSGPEVSALAFTDGKTVVPMVPSCDYKRVYDGDEGPNTGGMGAYSPPGFVDAAMQERILRTILEPTVAALAAEGIVYQGVLYAGLMMTAEGPKVLEYNVRFGDPETQAVLPRLKTDLVDIALAVAHGRLAEIAVEWDERATCGVVLASGGYPGPYSKGLPITGLERLDDGIRAFHAGTAVANGGFVTAGGRVLTLVAMGRDMAEARQKVYANAERVSFPGRHYRRDIAAREVR